MLGVQKLRRNQLSTIKLSFQSINNRNTVKNQLRFVQRKQYFSNKAENQCLSLNRNVKDETTYSNYILRHVIYCYSRCPAHQLHYYTLVELLIGNIILHQYENWLY